MADTTHDINELKRRMHGAGFGNGRIGAAEGYVIRSRRRSFETALGEYQARRDEQVLPMYEFTAELAALAPPPPEMQQLLSAVSRSQEARDGFTRVAAGVTSPAEFFADENAERILAAVA